MGEIRLHVHIVLRDRIYCVKLTKVHSVFWQGKRWHLIAKHVIKFGQYPPLILGNSDSYFRPIDLCKVKRACNVSIRISKPNPLREAFQSFRLGIRFRLACRANHARVFVAIRICHLIIGMIFQQVSLVDSIVSLFCWMTSIKLRKKTPILQCCRARINRYGRVNSHQGPF